MAKQKRSKKGGKHEEVFEANKKAIFAATVDLSKKYQRVPTQREIAAHTGLSLATVNKHMKAGTMADFVQQARSLTPHVMLAHFKGAVAGNASLIKLWYQVFEGWNESVVFRDKTEEDKFSNLPVEKLEQLMEIGELMYGENQSDDITGQVGLLGGEGGTVQ
jgi:hypothetical protein